MSSAKESLDIGLQRGTVRVDPYSSRWAAAFEEEEALLTRRLATRLLSIEHIGSTAVPGLAAKPLIDIQAAVASLDGIDDIVAVLADMGYAVIPERFYPDRIFLPKGPEHLRTHHLNLVLPDSSRWRDPLIFRDRLRADPSLQRRYADLKVRLAQKHADDRDRYTIGKEEFIRAVLHPNGGLPQA